MPPALPRRASQAISVATSAAFQQAKAYDQLSAHQHPPAQPWSGRQTAAMLFTLSIMAFACLVLLSLWAFRYRLVEYLPDHIAARFRDYAPVGTFEAAMEGGFQSSTFDLSANLEDDQRQGLDEAGLTQVRRIMDIQRVTFDEARFIRSQQIMRKNGIDPNTGLPLDKKAITHL